MAISVGGTNAFSAPPPETLKPISTSVSCHDRKLRCIKITTIALIAIVCLGLFIAGSLMSAGVIPGAFLLGFAIAKVCLILGGVAAVPLTYIGAKALRSFLLFSGASPSERAALLPSHQNSSTPEASGARPPGMSPTFPTSSISGTTVRPPASSPSSTTPEVPPAAGGAGAVALERRPAAAGGGSSDVVEGEMQHYTLPCSHKKSDYSEAAIKVKLEKNMKKAIDEHKKGRPPTYFSFATAARDSIRERESACYATAEEAVRVDGRGKVKPRISIQVYADQTLHRESMEDAHFIEKLPYGILVGVFDGHGGPEVSEFAAENFPGAFSTYLPGDSPPTEAEVFYAFEKAIAQVQRQIVLNSRIRTQGSTAVICYVDKTNNEVYTATLGDSEANIYRNIGEGYKSIPLSVVRDWSSEKDATRAKICFEERGVSCEGIVDKWKAYPNPKHLRFPSQGLIEEYKGAIFGDDMKLLPCVGTNVSRAFGDYSIVASSHKPKITKQKFKKGDILTLVCDGIKDYVPEYEICEIMSKCGERDPKSIAKVMHNQALRYMNRLGTGDNISAMVIKFD